MCVTYVLGHNDEQVSCPSWSDICSLSSNRETLSTGAKGSAFMEYTPMPGTGLLPLCVLSHLILTSEVPLGESPVIIPILQRRNWGLVEVQGFAQRWWKSQEKEISLSLTLVYTLPAKPSHHTKGVCSQLGEERHFGVHTAFYTLLLHFRVSALEKELQDIVRRGQSSDFWPSPYRKSATKEMCYYKHRPTLGKMHENTDQQNLLFSHSLLTRISEWGFVKLPKQHAAPVFTAFCVM